MVDLFGNHSIHIQFITMDDLCTSTIKFSMTKQKKNSLVFVNSSLIYMEKKVIEANSKLII